MAKLNLHEMECTEGINETEKRFSLSLYNVWWYAAQKVQNLLSRVIFSSQLFVFQLCVLCSWWFFIISCILCALPGFKRCFQYPMKWN